MIIISNLNREPNFYTMYIKQFEDILAWQKAQDLAVKIYGLFNKSKDFGFRDQICRASVSVSNNIAEGFDRKSKAEFKRFLIYSRASCGEVKSMIYLGERLSYIEINNAKELHNTTTEISKMINGLIRSLN